MSRRAPGTTLSELAAAAEQRRSIATSPRARRLDKPAIGAPARRRRRRRGGTVSAARWLPPPERNRPRQRPQAKSASLRALHLAPRERAAATEAPRPSVTPSRVRAPRRRERGYTAEPAPGAPAQRRRQRRRERRATATAPRGEATAPTITRRDREPLSTTHRAKRASYCRGRAAAEHHAAASAATPPSRREERQRGAAGSGAVSAA